MKLPIKYFHVLTVVYIYKFINNFMTKSPNYYTCFGITLPVYCVLKVDSENA